MIALRLAPAQNNQRRLINWAWTSSSRLHLASRGRSSVGRAPLAAARSGVRIPSAPLSDSPPPSGLSRLSLPPVAAAAAAAADSKSVDVKFTRADGSLATFPQTVRAWCGPYDDENRDIKGVHVLAGELTA